MQKLTLSDELKAEISRLSEGNKQLEKKITKVYTKFMEDKGTFLDPHGNLLEEIKNGLTK